MWVGRMRKRAIFDAPLHVGTTLTERLGTFDGRKQGSASLSPVAVRAGP